MTATTLKAPDLKTTSPQWRADAPRPGALAQVLSRMKDVAVMTRRNLVHIAREPMQLSDVTVQPVLFTVLFIYIFGSGMSLPGGASYTQFAVAGVPTHD